MSRSRHRLDAHYTDRGHMSEPARPGDASMLPAEGDGPVFQEP
jgi:hypothetical protein